MHLNPLGRNWSLEWNYDDLGKFYIGFIVAWTVILAAGIVWLVVHRQIPSVRIRNVGLSSAAVIFLHVYLMKIFLAYTTNGHFTCRAEFWIMSIYLPFGIALFQASTVQLESISEEQQALLRRESDDSQDAVKATAPVRKWHLGLWSRWRVATAAERTYVYIAIGMAIQLIVTGVIYATSPTLQGDWSSYGDITHAKGQAKCRRSTRWISSAFWQLFWSWVYGPYLLYKIRNVRDVHYWRLQVFLTVLAGLPGVPLWLAALFAPTHIMKPLNKWWVPPMWLAPGIIVMQAVTIFFPIFEAYKDKFQLRKTLGIIQTWEESHRNDDRQSMSQDRSFTIYEKHPPSRSDSTRRPSEMYTMAALEKALAINPQPLLQFAATQDFTAENIMFLMQCRRWHTEWDRAVALDAHITPGDKSRLFTLALAIYMTSISTDLATFPVNIESRIRFALDEVFDPCVPESDGQSTSGGSFNSFDTPPPALDSLAAMEKIIRREPSSDSAKTLWEGPTSSSPKQSKSSLELLPNARPLGAETVTLARGVGKSIFDEAEASIKYLVLTNTWQKLVKAHEKSNSS